MIELKGAGVMWSLKAHNIGDKILEARYGWRPSTKAGAKMRMKAVDAKRHFLRHPMTRLLVKEVSYTQDRLHPTTGAHQKVHSKLLHK